MTDAPPRPDPDDLLARLRQQQRADRRGRLKIWLGAAPGVGKTFAMLTAARRAQLQGLDVVVGWIDTHGRAETAALLHGLEVLPRRRVDYDGRAFEEFDLAAALARRPALLLVDELAHTNVPGGRFAKRWQDVEAIRQAGIDVETTLNVQHVDSVVDVVQQVTGVLVRETVPDHVLDEATEVVLVDLAPEALLERLRSGKVYLPEVAVTAAAGFFKVGNLIALRELALRRTAAWVDARLQSHRSEHGVERPWGAAERVLVAVGPSPLSARLVRAAHRTAVGLRAEWFAVFVERARARLAPAARERVHQHLRLAESLGARTTTLTAQDPTQALLDFAREHDIARIVVGKTGSSRWREALFGSLPNELIRRSGPIDVHVVRGPEDVPLARTSEPGEPAVLPERRPWWSWREAACMVGTQAVAVGVALLAYQPSDLATEAMILILGVVVVSLWCRTAVSIVGVGLAAAAFNWFFTEPRFTFAIADGGYVLAFFVMLVIGTVLTTLVQRVRERTAAAVEREHEVAALYSLARELAAAASETAIAQALVAHLRDLVPGELVVLLPVGGTIADPGCVAASHGVPDWLGPGELGLARWCLDQGRAAGAGTDHLPGSKALFLPIVGQRGKVGVFGCRSAHAAAVLAPRVRTLVTTGITQAAAAIERLQAQHAQQHERQVAQTERLRSTLLASVSHDLRTPLAGITGAASTLLDAEAALGVGERQELLQGVLDEANRLNELIGNLLFATRLDAGQVALRTEWTSLEEIVGAALRRAQPRLGARPVALVVDPGVPLVEADAVLLEQAVFQLLDNAAAHTPATTTVRVCVFADDAHVGVVVADDGPGLLPELQSRLFGRFERGAHSGGMGLGLAIGAAIAKAHGGALELVGAAHGATFRLTMSRPQRQPRLPTEAEIS